jgi:hypothetical protein
VAIRQTGCAARGLCGFSGTVIWQPPPTATLQATIIRDHGQTNTTSPPQPSATLRRRAGEREGGVTTADVRFAPDGSAGSASTCNDAAFTGADIDMPVHLRAASLTLAAAVPSLLGHAVRGPPVERHREPAGEARRRRRVVVARLTGSRSPHHRTSPCMVWPGP